MQAIVFTTTSLLELAAMLALTIICPRWSLSTNKDIDYGNYHPRVPMWVHPFGSTSNCSVRTQAGDVAHLEIPEHNNKGRVIHRRRRRHRKKQRKQELLLEEHVLLDHVSSNLLTADDILDDIIVFDGGDAGYPPHHCSKECK